MLLSKLLITLSLFSSVDAEKKTETYPAVPQAIKQPVLVGKEVIAGSRDMTLIRMGIIKCRGTEGICLIIHDNGSIELPTLNGGSEFIETNGYELLEDGIRFW